MVFVIFLIGARNWWRSFSMSISLLCFFFRIKFSVVLIMQYMYGMQQDLFISTEKFLTPTVQFILSLLQKNISSLVCISLYLILILFYVLMQTLFHSYFSGTYNRNTHIFDIPSYDHVKSLTGHIGAVTAVTASPGGRYLFTASSDSTAMVGW